MSGNWHITKNGEPGRCKAETGNCPLGGEHFDNPEDARDAFESDMRDKQFISIMTKSLNDDVAFQRGQFFNEANEANYTLIDTETGTVFSTNAVVMEEPEGDDHFHDHAGDYVDMDAEFNVQPLHSATSLEGYTRPVIVERDTELVVGINPKHIYAVNHSKEIIDFDEILESHSAAEECAETQGFRLWS